MRRSMFEFSWSTARPELGYVVIASLLLLFFIMVGKLDAVRVGDGCEYYGLFLALHDTLRPWMSAAAFKSYDVLLQTHTISGLIPTASLTEAFPALKLGSTADFNHFWFYSFLAFLANKAVAIFGVDLGPQGSFLSVHWMLFSITGCVAFRLYGVRGVVAVFLMTLCSPILWFTNKVHTEIFTYCLSLLGVMFVFSRLYLFAALVFAIASTQNPSFALVALIPFAYRFVLYRHLRYSFMEVGLIIATVILVLAHPVYYFLRFGVPTPQLLAGGASLGSNISIFYIWILDPDLGLLPNWPVGILLIAIAAVMKWRLPSRIGEGGDIPFYLFITGLFLINFYAHSSTVNLNSGATLGVARYSLWYLPAFFSLVYYVIRRFPNNSAISGALSLVIMGVALCSVKTDSPSLPEDYSDPSALSLFVQTNFPHLYSPPPEVFSERYSGYGEWIQPRNVRGVLGPDCNKLLLFSGVDRELVTVPRRCLLDQVRLQDIVKNKWSGIADDSYVSLRDIGGSIPALKLSTRSYKVTPEGNGAFILRSGWYPTQPTGAFSKSGLATLELPCNSDQFYSTKESLDMDLNLRGFGAQNVEISQRGLTLFSGVVDAEQVIPLTLKTWKCSGPLELDIKTSNFKVANGIATVEDPKIGVILTGFLLKP